MLELEIHFEIVGKPDGDESTEKYMARHVINLAGFNDSMILKINQSWNLIYEQVEYGCNNKIIPEVVRDYVKKLESVYVTLLRHNGVLGDIIIGAVNKKEISDILSENGILINMGKE